MERVQPVEIAAGVERRLGVGRGRQPRSVPLVGLTDFGGAMTRSVSDLADMLNVLVGSDPEDPATAPADSRTPADWRSVLDIDALKARGLASSPRCSRAESKKW